MFVCLTTHFNRIIKDKQMDVHVRYWDADQQCSVARYLTSEFLGHCTAQYLLRKFKEATNIIDPSNIIEVSIYGPNVNLKFYRDFTTDRWNEQPAAPPFLYLGCYGIRVIHGAFKNSVNATGSKMDHLRRSLYYLFCDSLARCKDYSGITGSQVFPTSVLFNTLD